MTTKKTVYNPLDKTNLGTSVANALLAQDLHPLADLSRFHGAECMRCTTTGIFLHTAASAQ